MHCNALAAFVQDRLLAACLKSENSFGYNENQTAKSNLHHPGDGRRGELKWTKLFQFAEVKCGPVFAFSGGCQNQG